MLRTRIGLVLGTAVFGVAGALGLAACGPADTSTLTAAMGPEAQALQAIGFTPADLPAADPAPAASAPDGKADGKARARALRAYLRHNTLHAEATVQTKKGVQVIDVQRGTITAIDGTTVTVKSTDGFTLAWTFAGNVRVVIHRQPGRTGDLKTGTEIGIAGLKDGGTTTARLIVVPNQ